MLSTTMMWVGALDWIAIGQIILIDILLGGDNALLIALACRNLPPRQRRLGILWGTAGAIVLRVILITIAVQLLDLPGLKLVGGLLLLWIGIKLVIPAKEDAHGNIAGSDKLIAAVKTIIIADLVMSIDNVIAIAGAAKQAEEAQRFGLVVFGLLVSVPIIVFGSQLILKLFDRFPIIITAGGALLGWIAGELIVNDPLLEDFIPQTNLVIWGASVAGAVGVVAVALLMGAKRAPKASSV